MMLRAVFGLAAFEKNPKVLNNHLILLGVPNMKISILGPLSLAALALAAGSAFADAGPNVQDSSGNAVKDSSGACIVSNGVMLPECRPAKAPAPAAPASPGAPAAPASPNAPAAAAKPAPSSVRQAIVIQADALFDFDKSVVRPDGKKSIDEALAKLNGVSLEMVIATGHTDSIGTDAYNQKLSERRAAAVKDYLVSKGIPAAKVTTIGKGETQPVATNKTKEGRQKNRRVDIEFKGVRQ
jgi:OmpA-OmpF porin, OOP family